jgi:hypothetical protein
MSKEIYKECEALHAQAMPHANAGFTHRFLGHHDEARTEFRTAWRLEREAAMKLIAEQLEPSRSILFRSAASLALLCGEIEDAQKLAYLGLGGEPPLRVREVLLNILADAQIRAQAGSIGEPDSVREEILRLSADAEPPVPVDVTWNRAA